MFQLSFASLQCPVPYFCGPQGTVRTFPLCLWARSVWRALAPRQWVIDLRDIAVDAEKGKVTVRGWAHTGSAGLS